MTSKTKKPSRNIFVMLIAAVIWLTGLTLVILGVVNIAVFGWWALTLVASGLSSMYFASMALLTGKPEWILLDLLIPG